MKSSAKNKKTQSVWATVVTHNRLDMLKQCIEALRLQTRRPDKILVVNNASSDGTQEWLEKQPGVDFITQENSGSAGGQYTAFKTAYEGGADWVWTMDDDVIAEPDALEALLGALDIVPDASFLCSVVESGMEPGIIMNLPGISRKSPQKNYYPQWPKYLGKGLVEIEAATFVSLLVSRRTVQQIGYPIKELFIWGDDTDFTRRCASVGEGFLVGNSRVSHRRANPQKIGIVYENDPKRMENYIYSVRNSFFCLRRSMEYRNLSKIGSALRLFKKYISDLLRIRESKSQKFRKLVIYHKGVWRGLRFSPVPEKPENA